MKKLKILAVALVSVLALSAVTMAVAKNDTKKWKTTVSAKYNPGSSSDPYNPYKNAKFKGDVNSKKGKCYKRRKVKALTKQGVKIGSDLTNKHGSFKIKASGYSSGKYTIKVPKYKFKGNGSKKYNKVCKSAKATVKVN